MDKNLEISLLFDFYGQLLADTQKQAVELYCNDDLSLAETAEILGISRQGVRDAFNRAVKNLYEYEQRLGLCKRFSITHSSVLSIVQDAENIKKITDNDNICDLAQKIIDTVHTLYE